MVAVMLIGCGRSPAGELNTAERTLEYRPVEGRLSGSPYAKPPSEGRAGKVTGLAKLNKRKVLELSIAQQSDELRARALLLGGELGAAKHLLQKITSRRGAHVTTWNDYAAALHADAAPDDALQLSMSLAAADRALDLQPTMPEALFNRALILDALALHGEAASACKKYLEVDSSSEWAREIRERLRNIESARSRIAAWRDVIDDLERAAEAGDELFINDVATTYPEEARRRSDLYLARWGERFLARDRDGAARMLMLCRVIGRALESNRGESLVADAVRAIEVSGGSREHLARAHVSYEQGRKAIARRENALALRTLDEAQRQFRAHGSPTALSARLYMAIAADDHASATTLRDLASNAPTRYRALHAQIQWQLAVLNARGESHTSALQSIRSATATFEALGEEQNALVTRGMTAALLAASGDTSSAWRMRHALMTSAAETGNDFRLMYAVYTAARDAISDGRWDIAYSLLNVVAGESHPHDRLREDAIVWSALAASRAGMPRAAAAALAKARATKRMPDDLRLVEALVAQNEDETVSLLTQSLGSTADATATARLLLARARTLREMREPRRAQDDLERSVKLIESGQVIVAPARIRDAVIGSPLDAFGMLADMLDRSGNPARAQEMLEHFRTWPLAIRTQPPRIHSQTLPSSIVIVSYGLFRDRVVIYANDIRATVTVTSAEVKRLAAAFEESIEQNDISRFDDVGRQLSRILVEPITAIAQPGGTLVFERDPALVRLPFGALMLANGRYLIEEHPVVITPSTTAWLQSLHRKPRVSRAVLSIGNPLSDERTGSLADAEAEAKEIAAMYPSRVVLIGASATKQRVISNLAYCDAAHFAVHANAGIDETIPPHLTLTATRDDAGRLTAAEIAALELDHIRTVVLAGCRTAAGTRSLVEAFLAAGAGSVIGTLWEVDDAATREMSITFHRSLRNGATPAAALRAAQIDMIRRMASPRVWASLQLYGSGL